MVVCFYVLKIGKYKMLKKYCLLYSLACSICILNASNIVLKKIVALTKSLTKTRCNGYTNYKSIADFYNKGVEEQEKKYSIAKCYYFRGRYLGQCSIRSSIVEKEARKRGITPYTFYETFLYEFTGEVGSSVPKEGYKYKVENKAYTEFRKNFQITKEYIDQEEKVEKAYEDFNKSKSFVLEKYPEYFCDGLHPRSEYRNYFKEVLSLYFSSDKNLLCSLGQKGIDQVIDDLL